MIFSKIFSSVLFEVGEAHGTNFLFDYENNFMKIIIRFQNDELPLSWEPKEESESFLEDLRGKLIAKMHSALGSETGEERVEKVDEVPKKKKPLSHEKAQHILDAIRRIP